MICRQRMDVIKWKEVKTRKKRGSEWKSGTCPRSEGRGVGSR